MWHACFEIEYQFIIGTKQQEQESVLTITKTNFKTQIYAIFAVPLYEIVSNKGILIGITKSVFNVPNKSICLFFCSSKTAFQKRKKERGWFDTVHHL